MNLGRNLPSKWDIEYYRKNVWISLLKKIVRKIYCKKEKERLIDRERERERQKERKKERKSIVKTYNIFSLKNKWINEFNLFIFITTKKLKCIFFTSLSLLFSTFTKHIICKLSCTKVVLFKPTFIIEITWEILVWREGVIECVLCLSMWLLLYIDQPLDATTLD